MSNMWNIGNFYYLYLIIFFYSNEFGECKKKIGLSDPNLFPNNLFKFYKYLYPSQPYFARINLSGFKCGNKNCYSEVNLRMLEFFLLLS